MQWHARATTDRSSAEKKRERLGGEGGERFGRISNLIMQLLRSCVSHGYRSITLKSETERMTDFFFLRLNGAYRC